MCQTKREGEDDCEMMLQDQMGSPVADDVITGGGSPHPHRGSGPTLKKGPWTTAEDAILVDYVNKHGEGNWNVVETNTGLFRCGKSCRLRWANHLRPAFTPEEERLIVQLDAEMGNKRWARMAAHVIYSNNSASHLERHKKSWPNYTLNTLLFACTMLFSVYMNPSSSTSITIKILLVVDVVIFFIINAVFLIKLPNWGNALACISWFLLELAMCLLILPFNRWYAVSILAVLVLIVAVALLQPKFQYSVKKYVLPSFTTDDGNTHCDIGDEENDYLNHLFNISNGIATCGGLVTGILGYYSNMERLVTAAGFFFFCTVLLGLYLMMVIAVRAVSATHAACLAIVLKALLLLTIITASVSFVRHSSVAM